MLRMHTHSSDSLNRGKCLFTICKYLTIQSEAIRENKLYAHAAIRDNEASRTNMLKMRLIFGAIYLHKLARLLLIEKRCGAKLLYVH